MTVAQASTQNQQHHMEHRCACRVAVGAECILRSAVAGEGTVVIRDVSLGGVFVEQISVVLPLMSVVYLDLACAREARAEQASLSVPAMVVRIQGDGVALMFDRMRPGILSRVLSLGKAGALPLHT